MHRQDSGYESIAPRSSQGKRRRTSTASSGSRPRPRRPSVRRATKSGPVAHLPRTGGQSLYRTRSNQAPLPTTFFHFPSPEPEDSHEGGPDGPLPPHSSYPYRDAPEDQAVPDNPTYHAPPQTTHYWTSDRTRRLEYAAIDAASRGVKGWVMKHMVPECFVPKGCRRLGFDDDRGSVRRYRLELDSEESIEKDGLEHDKKRRTWFWAGSGSERA